MCVLRYRGDERGAKACGRRNVEVEIKNVRKDMPASAFLSVRESPPGIRAA